MRTRITFILLGLLASLFVATAPAQAQQAQQSRYPNSDVYHTYQGSDQAFGVICNGGRQVWVQKGQFAYSKCSNYGQYPQWINMPANFRAWCTNLGNYNPAWEYLVSGGSTVTIWGNSSFQCRTQPY
jgi:hypothetical protein